MYVKVISIKEVAHRFRALLFINDQTNSKSQYLQESHNVRAGVL